MKKVKWGTIGCGDVAEVKSGPALQKAENSELIAVMRRNGALARDFAQRHNVPKWYDNAQDLINDHDINAIYVATPPSTHKKFTIAAAQAGKPVYVEKPMAINYQECQEMIAACQKNNVALYTAYYRRALPGFLKIKELLDRGQIGDIISVNIRLYQKPHQQDLEGVEHWRVKPEIAGGGYFYDLAPHMIDLLQYYFGPIVAAQGYTANQGELYAAEDNVIANLKFENGLLAAGAWNFHSTKEIDQTELIGSKGYIQYSTFEDNPIILYTKGNREEFEIRNPNHIQQPLIQSVIDDLLNNGECPSTGQTGALTNRVMDQIFGSEQSI